MSDAELTAVARANETFARFCWDPYMHNPKLRHRLHRVTTPTLVIWGEKDGIVTTAYGEAYAKLIPGAKFATVPGAGHYPHLEAPDAFLSTLNGFIQ
jgi:pimeloyl-ACP methyl ester carboxylesterase